MKVLTNYLKIYDSIVDVDTHIINEKFNDGTQKYITKIFQDFLTLYDKELQVIETSETYTNPSAHAELCNHYDDLTLFKKYYKILNY